MTDQQTRERRPAMTSNLTTLRLAGGAQGFNWLPVFVADEQGMFARAGIDVDYLRMGSVDKATAAVADGTADLAITPPEGAVVDSVTGGDLRIVANNSERLPMSMVARPGITSLDGLRGARIGTSSLTEGTAIYTRAMLDTVGLHYPDDYSFVLNGVHTARWQALQDGDADAAPQPAPWNFLAADHGYQLLGDVSDAIPEIIFAAVIATQTWIDAHRDLLARFLHALAEGHDFVNDPGNDDVTLPIYQRITTPDDESLARRGLEYTRELGMWPGGLRMSPSAFETTVDVMIRTGLLTAEQRGEASRVLAGSIEGRRS